MDNLRRKLSKLILDRHTSEDGTDQELDSVRPGRSFTRLRSKSRSRSRGGRDSSVDSASSLFPLTERDGSRSPLERTPSVKRGPKGTHVVGTGASSSPKPVCPTCARAHWTWMSYEHGVVPWDAPEPQYSPHHHHEGPYGHDVTPVVVPSKQSASYFDIPIGHAEIPRTPPSANQPAGYTTGAYSSGCSSPQCPSRRDPPPT